MSFFRRWPSDSSVLPTKAHSGRVLSSRRYSRLVVFATAFCGFVVLYWLYSWLTDDPNGGLPPLYQKYTKAERKLPQHNENLPWPEGKHAKFIWFSNFPNNVGWGNVLQEMIMNTQLAYTLKRAYVFSNYTWNAHTDYSEYNGHLIPSKVPLSAMLAGPIAGGSMGKSDVPRAVSSDYFKMVCPEPTIIHTQDVKARMNDPSAMEIINTWVEELGKKEDRCIQIEPFTAQVFDYTIFGSHKIIDVWPALSKSPFITKWAWSQTILNAYKTNEHFFKRRSIFNPFADTSNSIVDGLMAVHIRHGDFKDHCNHLAKWSSQYNGFNTFDSLPDRFTPPGGHEWGENTPENYQIYENHCIPSIPQIVKRVEEIKAERKGHGVTLKRFYVLTNAKKPWLAELKDALDAAAPGEWDMIATSRELKLNKEQLYIAQTLDMYVATRAQVFIGNGFSSLTSNVVMLRMANGVDPLDTRFW